MIKPVSRLIVLLALAAAACAAPGMARAQDSARDAPSIKKSEVTVQVAGTNLFEALHIAEKSPSSSQGQRDKPEAVTAAVPAEVAVAESAPRTSEATMSHPVAVKTEAAGQPNPQTEPEDGWQFQLTPYIWFSGLEGTVGARGLTREVDASFADIIDEFNIGAMGAFEARRGRLLLLTDMQYIRLTDQKETPGGLFSDAEIEIKQFVFEPKAGFRAVQGKAGHVDLFAGVRVWHLSTDINLGAGLLPAASASASKNWVDPIFGARFQLNLSPKIFVAGKGDGGGFGAGSESTWQLLAAVGYNLNERYSLLTGYRYLSVNYRSGGFIYDTNMKGLVTGLGIRF